MRDLVILLILSFAMFAIPIMVFICMKLGTFAYLSAKRSFNLRYKQEESESNEYKV